MIAFAQEPKPPKLPLLEASFDLATASVAFGTDSIAGVAAA